MSWVHFVGKRAKRSTNHQSELALRTWIHGPRRLYVCVLAILGIIALGYIVSLRTYRAPQARPSRAQPIADSIAGITGTELVTTRIVTTRPQEPSPFRFAEIAQESGVAFVHFSGMTEERYAPTANGSGIAIFDYDKDGKLDLYFATATLLPLGTAAKGTNRLYKNLGNNQFQDVTQVSGLAFAGYCHGIVVGDIDNDGDQDVFLCNTVRKKCTYDQQW